MTSLNTHNTECKAKETNTPEQRTNYLGSSETKNNTSEQLDSPTFIKDPDAFLQLPAEPYSLISGID